MRSKRRQIREKRKKGKIGITLLKIFIPIFILLLGLVFLFLNTKFWNGKDKFIYVTRSSDGGAKVVILDPRLDEETSLTIPGDTEVSVARNLGTLRLRNVWQLGINEKLDGQLIAETVTQNFQFPVFLWKDDLTKKTNIPLGDSLLTKIFILGIKSVAKTEVDLGKSQFLTKVRLSDGQLGYRLTTPVSSILTAYFSDNEISNKNLRVEVVDATGDPGVAQKVGEIVETLGGKVVAIDKKTKDVGLDCVVIAKNTKVGKKIRNLFSCSDGGTKTDFDIEIRVGEKFAKRF